MPVFAINSALSLARLFALDGKDAITQRQIYVFFFHTRKFRNDLDVLVAVLNFESRPARREPARQRTLEILEEVIEQPIHLPMQAK